MKLVVRVLCCAVCSGTFFSDSDIVRRFHEQRQWQAGRNAVMQGIFFDRLHTQTAEDFFVPVSSNVNTDYYTSRMPESPHTLLQTCRTNNAFAYYFEQSKAAAAVKAASLASTLGKTEKASTGAHASKGIGAVGGKGPIKPTISFPVKKKAGKLGGGSVSARPSASSSGARTSIASSSPGSPSGSRSRSPSPSPSQSLSPSQSPQTSPRVSAATKPAAGRPMSSAGASPRARNIKANQGRSSISGSVGTATAGATASASTSARAVGRSRGSSPEGTQGGDKAGTRTEESAGSDASGVPAERRALLDAFSKVRNLAERGIVNKTTSYVITAKLGTPEYFEQLYIQAVKSREVSKFGRTTLAEGSFLSERKKHRVVHKPHHHHHHHQAQPPTTQQQHP
jgi:hypothetical protein